MTRVSQFCDKGRFSCKISFTSCGLGCLGGEWLVKLITISGPPFPLKRGARLTHRKDQLDLAGQAILSLLEEAADAAEENNRRAVEAAQKLSTQLRAAGR
jgi:hypothetical protein